MTSEAVKSVARPVARPKPSHAAAFTFSHAVTGLLLSKSRTLWSFVDLIVASASFIFFAWLSPKGWFNSWNEIWVAALVFAGCFVAAGLGNGLYERENRFAPRAVLQLGFVAAVMAGSLSLTVIFFVFYWKVGRYLVGFGSLGGFLGIVFYRWILSFLIGRYPYRFTILGEPSIITEEIREFSARPRRGVRYLHVDDVESLLSKVGEWSHDDMVTTLHSWRVLDIVLTENASKDPRIMDLCVRAMQAGCRVIDEIHFYGELFQCFPSKILSENWVILSGIDTHRPVSQFGKRAFDLVFGVLCAVLLAPLMALVALGIKLSSPGPVFFVQDRQGRFGRPFKIFKFRTMAAVVNGDHPPSTRQGDARVTAIGRLLRPLHIDELPQIWNIIMGDMSFVGPRPEVYSFTQEITREVPIYAFRCLVRPGLSGLSQVSVGYTLDNAQDTLVKLAYDLYYIKNYTFMLDLLIIVRTLFTLTRRAW